MEKSPISRVSPTLSVGSEHACYRASGGKVYCWGTDDVGELGSGMPAVGSAVPVAVLDMSDAKAVSAGSEHSCALLADGRIKCWGDNSLGELGTGNRDEGPFPTPVRVAGITTAIQVSAGGAYSTPHTCALLRNQTVVCWGGNHDGQLGDGRRHDSRAPVRVKGIRGAVQVSAGARHSCALLASGRIDCWGYGIAGQLGNGKKRSSRIPVRVQGITHALEVSAGGDQTCALISDGAVECWGGNGNGELGIGTKKPLESSVPLKVELPGKAAAVSAGGEDTCALLKGGTVDCWGSNNSDQLGTGKTFDSLVNSYRPLQVKGLGGATSVSVGDVDVCARASGGVECWGDNSLGQLTDDMNEVNPTPVVVAGVTNAVSISVGACAVLSNGRVSCWGNNLGGQLGLSPAIEDRTVPILLPKVRHAVRVSGDCALISGGTVSCWGVNDAGQLGNGTKTDSLAPVKVKGITNAVEIGVGDQFSCALLSNHTVECWGADYASQLGDGSLRDHTTPVRVSGVTDAVSLDVGNGREDTACVVLATGKVECWGDDDPTDPMADTGSELPTEVAGINSAVEASVSSECALLSDGTVTCWGVDPLNPDPDQGSIHQITGLENGVQISGSCALLSSGGVDCWGGSLLGQLGNGTVSFEGSEDTAVSATGITNASAISGNAYDACAVLADGTVRCWGENGDGQLGNGQEGFSPVPVAVTGLPSS